MKVRFSDAAEIEIEEAIDYYNTQRPKLGLEFFRELNRTVERIAEYPEAWSPISARARRCPLRRFPYTVIYFLRPEALIVVAVMHHRRDPKSWQTRINSDQP